FLLRHRRHRQDTQAHRQMREGGMGKQEQRNRRMLHSLSLLSPSDFERVAWALRRRQCDLPANEQQRKGHKEKRGGWKGTTVGATALSPPLFSSLLPLLLL